METPSIMVHSTVRSLFRIYEEDHVIVQEKNDIPIEDGEVKTVLRFD